ncbi:hypothetical protein KIN20_014164 [Parelaphostrongylus tenuis]|uniref:Uncharacterized protein n=1 Tax=Parelaphostrongylus tenuis TaxID=148309 RepID=A0AAD5QN57_PARTN|nr:hypothetical protein KIN20_014164 [Parelaphostrongylus tenuis]
MAKRSKVMSQDAGNTAVRIFLWRPFGSHFFSTAVESSTGTEDLHEVTHTRDS